MQDVSEAARGVCEAEADRLDSELSMLRYVAWAIPAIGFIGTSITLTILAAANSGGTSSVVDRISGASAPAATEAPAEAPAPASGSDLLPPAPAAPADGTAPAAPAADAPLVPNTAD